METEDQDNEAMCWMLARQSKRIFPHDENQEDEKDEEWQINEKKTVNGENHRYLDIASVKKTQVMPVPKVKLKISDFSFQENEMVELTCEKLVMLLTQGVKITYL